MVKEFKKIIFVIVLILCLAPVMYADWDQGDPYKMHFPQLPDPCGWDIDLRNYELADDWQCSETGDVNDIHFWFSWADDQPGTLGQFTVKIYRNDANMPSKPIGNAVWSKTFTQGQFTVRGPYYGDEGYWIPNPTTPSIWPHDHLKYYQVNIKNISEPFIQQADQIYWLSLKAPPDMYYYPGWKTSQNHFMDAAVVKYPAPWGWTPLWDPYYPTNQIDFAFVITSGPKLEPQVKWRQRPDLGPNGVDVMASDPLILADDFECNKTTKITDITVWGSWKDDYLPQGEPNKVSFTLSIHSDIPDPDPCDPYNYSMPNEVLWYRNITPSEVSIEREQINEGWYNPYYPEYYFPGDHVCWKYVFHIPEANAFCQQGEPTKPITYWLDVKAYPWDGYAQFGWKSSINHWNDDAVWAYGSEPYTGLWSELRYPYGHQLEGNSIDLAFAIDGNKPCIQPEDFGDAPDGAAAPLYPTLLINNGARHIIDGVTFMGVLVDAEGDGQPTANADGDDLNPPAPDDEDGVAFPVPLIPGQAASVTVTTSVAGALDAWIDFDVDGSWTAGDQIAAALPLAAGANVVGFAVPATATPGQTYARFRFSTAGGLQPFGPALNGEVEDYNVFIEQPQPEHELGDAPDSTNNFGLAMNAYPGVVANYPTVYLTGSPPFGPIHLQPQAVAWLGPGVTLENEADVGPDQDPTNNIFPPTNTSDQDLADDGVLNMPISLPKCYPQTTFNYQINVVNPAVGLYVNVWFDWNRDGDWNDTLLCTSTNTPEWAVQNQLFPAVSLLPGLNNVTTPPFRPWHSTLYKQNIWMRITLSEQPWVGTGSGGSGPAAGYYLGETEDYFFAPDPNCLFVGRVFNAACGPGPAVNLVVTPPMVTKWNWLGKPQCWCCDAQKCGNGVYTGGSLNRVDAQDLTSVGTSYGLSYMQVGYISCVDFNLSGRVDAQDLTILSLHYGKIVGSDNCL